MNLNYVQTTCPFCGTGCSMNLAVVDGVVSGTQPYHRSPVNEGRLCIKGGFCEEYLKSPDRIMKPLIRKDGRLQEVSWEEAISFTAQKLKEFKPDEVACIASARTSNEDIYAMVKLAKDVIKTGNIDNTQSCLNAGIGTGISKSVGFDASTCSIDAILSAKIVAVVGANLYVQNPILISQITSAKKAGAKVLYASSVANPTGNLADEVVTYKESAASAFINAVAAEIIKAGKYDKAAEKVAGFAEFKKSVASVTADAAGVSEESVKSAAELLTSGKGVFAFSPTAISEAGSRAMANLALLTGNADGILILRSRNNGQGAVDIGAVPAEGNGFAAVLAGKAKAVYIVGDSPKVCECGYTETVEALKKAGLVILQDCIAGPFMDAAHVVLPSAALPEKDGTQTNTERRIQRVHKAADAPEMALPDWKITADIAAAMGKDFGWKSCEDVFAEMIASVPAYKGISLEQTDKPEAVMIKESVKPAFTVAADKEA